jgi:hypothetical protein
VILAANEKIAFYLPKKKIENQPRTSIRDVANRLGVSLFVVWLRVQNLAQEINT